MDALHIANSLTRQKERFEPINPPFVGMYVCGPTVYSNVHLGNVRTFLTFDIVYRYLQHLGFKVRYVRNITDVGHLTGDTDDGEDKIGKKARLENLEPMEVVQQYTNDFHDVMNVFNILRPSIEPTATGHIVEQIEAIKQIVDNGYAYEVNGSVYFSVRTFSEDHPYGELSGGRLTNSSTPPENWTAKAKSATPWTSRCGKPPTPATSCNGLRLGAWASQAGTSSAR